MSIFKRAFEKVASEQLAKGIEVEKEHDNTVRFLANEIKPGSKVSPNLLAKARKETAKDHLEEREDYYDGLDLAEKLPPKEIQKLRAEHHLT